MTGVPRSEKIPCAEHNEWQPDCRACFARDPVSRKQPTEAMFAYARKLSEERGWKDVRP